jgi:hypothetical protein
VVMSLAHRALSPDDLKESHVLPSFSVTAKRNKGPERHTKQLLLRPTKEGDDWLE